MGEKDEWDELRTLEPLNDVEAAGALFSCRHLREEGITTAKKYDLIVVGGGPGGLMAAKTAAEDGLKVVLIERKKEITKINRLCSETIVIQPSGFSTLREPSDKHIEPTSLSVEIAADKNMRN